MQGSFPPPTGRVGKIMPNEWEFEISLRTIANTGVNEPRYESQGSEEITQLVIQFTLPCDLADLVLSQMQPLTRLFFTWVSPFQAILSLRSPTADRQHNARKWGRGTISLRRTASFPTADRSQRTKILFTQDNVAEWPCGRIANLVHISLHQERKTALSYVACGFHHRSFTRGKLVARQPGQIRMIRVS